MRDRRGTAVRPSTRVLASLAMLALLSGACSSIVTLEAPSLGTVEARPDPLASRILAADGTQLAVLRREHREPVSLSEVPPHLIDAILTAEDQRFFDHGGVDARAMLRAALANRRVGDIQQGGSTITQQLVKLRYLPEAERTYDTKLTEAMLARELEADHTKAEILEEYLNAVYLGEGAYGVQAAADTYFRRDVRELEVHESALLAAIVRAPSSLAPTGEPEAARTRRDDVLRRMADAGHLTVEQRDAALDAPIDVHERRPVTRAREPHLVDQVIRTLLDEPTLGGTEEERADRLYGGGLTVHTTVDLDLQARLRDILHDHLPDADDPEAAVTLIEPATGHVLAATGNRSYDELQYDLPSQARRQPGSTFKTFVLAAAIADGHHPDEPLDGRPGTLDTGMGTWQVRNYERSDPGRVSLAGATRLSVNAAYARLGIDVGIDRVAATARSMGVASPVPVDEPQITLGGGRLGVTTTDMAAAYATLANGGTHAPTTVIERVTDAEGQVVWRPGEPTQALTPDVAYVTTEVLQGVVEGGTGLAARVPGWEVAGKTGTTSDHVDAWFAGTTPTVAAAVWVGHAEGQVPMLGVQGVPRVTGGTIPARIFADAVAAAVEGTDPVPFTLDRSHWVTVEIDPRSGLRAAAWCPGERVRVPRILAPVESCPEPPPRPAPTPAPPPPPAEDDDADEGSAEPDPDPDAGSGDGDGDDPPEPPEEPSPDAEPSEPPTAPEDGATGTDPDAGSGDGDGDGQEDG